MFDRIVFRIGNRWHFEIIEPLGEGASSLHREVYKSNQRPVEHEEQRHGFETKEQADQAARRFIEVRGWEPVEKPSEHSYKGRKIVLQPGKKDDGTWVCQGTIIIAGTGPDAGSEKFYPSGTFTTCAEAEAATLQEAKARIEKH
jgi:hypothetical protein